MLRKIVAIKNVGRFVNSAAPGDTQLRQQTLIVGANGYGKTTLCAVLRSLHSGEAAHVLGRRRLGTTNAPEIELLLEGGLARFDGTSWDATLPHVAIFDGVFVAQNVHAGDVVDIDQKRNLYRVIIGERGVVLAEEDARLAADSRAKTSQITAGGKALQPHAGAMALEDFLALATVDDLDERIEDQQRTVNATRQASAIRDRAPMTEFVVPELPVGLAELLAVTLEDVGRDAERLIADHFAARGMAANGERWAADGVTYADGECPFCGQDIRGLPLIEAYRAVFSARYAALKKRIDDARDSVTQALGEAALARLETIGEHNKAGAEFWAHYCECDEASLALPAELTGLAQALAEAASRLLARKTAAPLEAIGAEPEFALAEAAFSKVADELRATNRAIAGVNALITEKKTAMGAADLRTEDAALQRLRATQLRHRPDIAVDCAAYQALVASKQDTEKRKEAIRAQLDEHTRTVVAPYERSINAYLDDFNAGFTIQGTRHTYPGGIATSSYQIVINATPVDLGDSRTAADQPSFNNTLSAGDRTTLAMAFFLAHLHRDPDITQKLVVFDDPFCSQDAFRRRQTVIEIGKVAATGAQVIVLSHDPTFLKQIWDKAPPAARIALNLADHRAQGSKLMPGDLERACAGRTASDVDDLQTYLHTGAGALIDVIRKIRGVLETHCRTTYPGAFAANDYLGDMSGKIRVGGVAHPAAGIYDQLDAINDYTKQYHHGEDLADRTPDQIDDAELKGYTRKALRIINALQA